MRGASWGVEQTRQVISQWRVMASKIISNSTLCATIYSGLQQRNQSYITGLLWWGSTGTGGSPHKGLKCEKCLHAMTQPHGLPVLFTKPWDVLPPNLVKSGTWWRHQMETFSALLALCAGNSPVPVNSTHKGQWRGVLMFSLICAWINGWVNNRGAQAVDLRRHRCHYDVNVMKPRDLKL